VTACRWVRVLASGLLVALAGCAPRIEAPRLDAESLRTRFAAALESREARGRAAEGEVGLWASARSVGDLPGVNARLLLAGPDAFRLRVSSPFGTALDAFARGDSVLVFSPHDRRALVMPAASESIGIGDIGRLGCRFWSGAWRPPAASWQHATWAESLRVLRWSEADDSLSLTLGSNGLPASVTLKSAEGRAVLVRYEAWMSIEGTWWPSIARYADDARSFEIRCRIQRVKFTPRIEPERLAIDLPETVRFVTVADLGRALRRLVPN
jgi:hypothetical protein